MVTRTLTAAAMTLIHQMMNLFLQKYPLGLDQKPKKLPTSLINGDRSSQPPELDFVNVVLEPEPTDDTPYGYFKKFVNDDMFAFLATESNNYAHQKSGINLQTSAKRARNIRGNVFPHGNSEDAGRRKFLGD